MKTKAFGYIFTVVFTCLFLQLPAQNQAVIDSLQQRLHSETNDSSKVLILNTLCKYHTFADADKALCYAEEAYQIADSIENNYLKGFTLNNFGIAFYSKGDYVKATENLLLAVDIFRNTNHLLELGKSYHPQCRRYLQRQRRMVLLCY